MKKGASPSDARNILLVVAALISALTFQAGVSAPGGVWQDNVAGRVMYAAQKHAFYVFLISNTVALSSISILVFISLKYKFPFHFMIWVATGSMIVTYATSVFAITPRESVCQVSIHLDGSRCAFLLRSFIQMFNKCRLKLSHYYFL